MTKKQTATEVETALSGAVIDVVTETIALRQAQGQALALPIPVSTARGKEALDDSDIYPARLSLAQDTTPQAKKREDAYIDGLEPGMFFNSITGEIFGETVTIAVVGLTKRAVMLDEDGKIIERGLSWTDDRCISPGEDAQGKWIKPEATRIYDYLVVRVVDGEPSLPMAMSCKKTAFKAGKRFNSLLQQTKGEDWETLYTIGTQVETGGVNSYFVPTFRYVSMNGEKRKAPQSVIDYCSRMFQALSAGRVQEVEDTVDAPDAVSDIPF
jgi:hypothetical protein